ncbi:MAG TPA: signal peptidase II, partial [Acidimicrobiales bacterium]|nr:signal peptidase II [Acidimicrobiales bacterium]
MQERGAVAALTADDRGHRARDSAGAGRSLRLRVATAAVAVLVIVVDQVTKSVAVADFSRQPLHLVCPLSFQVAYNSGVAFSLFRGLTLWIVGLGLVLVCVLLAISRRMRSPLGAVSIGLVMGGALSNLADRLFRPHGGAVIDWIATRYWPTFNVADACIVVGVILFLWAGR